MDYEIIQPAISSGSFGTTYYAINKSDNKLYVIKQIALDKVQLGTLHNEINVLEEIKKKGCRKELLCLKEHYIDYDNQIMNLVTEAFVQEKIVSPKDIKVIDMRKFILNLQYQLSEKDLIKIIKGLIDAIDILHKMGIGHGDIKPENVLINEKLEIQIIDFGMSCTKYCSSGGTLSYSSPEMLLTMIRGKRALSIENQKTSDIFSLGLMIYELANLDFVSDLHLFGGEIKDRRNYMNILLMFYKRKMILSKYQYNNDINIMINKMLKINRLERPTSDELEIDINKIVEDIEFRHRFEFPELDMEMTLSTPSSEDFLFEGSLKDLMDEIYIPEEP